MDADDRRDAEHRKKPYRSPELVRLGSVRELTLKSGTALDGGIKKPATK